jgi:hypothetical protein
MYGMELGSVTLKRIGFFVFPLNTLRVVSKPESTLEFSFLDNFHVHSELVFWTSSTRKKRTALYSFVTKVL